ncbi:MAG: DNA methylase [Lachnospiraceae bacterium]|nr:DNA methylase [Lachnospiraceae bacterium]
MRQYISIDLKSFYASVEARERGLDPLTTNLVVADVSRTEKTICLAVSPSLKSFGIPGRARLFEVVQKVGEVNRARLGRAGAFTGESNNIRELNGNPSLKLSYIAARPRMNLYMEYSSRIYQVYLRYIAPEDIFAYSIDEVFIDATNYLHTYGLTAHELAVKMIREVLSETGITATAGIGTNMYLAKIAMDIMAKKAEEDADGVRIAELDEMSYRRQLWDHRPIRDFWRVGKGIAKRLESAAMYTMGDVARCSIENEDILYKMFGVNAELLIDHAWGWEPCTIDMVKKYVPEDRSFSSGQVLMEPYSFEKARIIVHEMADTAALGLVEKRMVTDQIVLTVNYEPMAGQSAGYTGEVIKDWYGRRAPKPAHGSQNLERLTSSGKMIVGAALEIFDRTVDRSLLVRRITLAVNHVLPEEKANEHLFEQMDLFTDYKEAERKEKELEKEKAAQKAELLIKNKFGKNAILKGVNFREGATGRDRNRQRGGHRE